MTNAWYWMWTLLVSAQAAASAGSARVESLLRQMTLEEKVGQLSQFSGGEATGPRSYQGTYGTMVAAGQIGSFLNVADATTTNAYQKIAVEQSRLHIPLLFSFDVIHGFRTIFPVNLGLAATWDPPLVERMARLSATEASAQGIRWAFSPMVDIARDARWGRIAEGAGEDPYLGSVMAAAYVRGYQGPRLGDPTSVLACAKHFVGYGAAEAGRDYNTTEISERTLREVYLPPFEASARAGAATFMAAFNALNGVPASANPFTLGQILREEWRFQGIVVSDWNSVEELIAHGIARRPSDAVARAFLAGVDVDMESGLYLAELPRLVRTGVVPMARVDQAVRRVLQKKLDLGLFEHPYVPAQPEPPTVSEESRLIARLAAEESFVLLKNERSLLPLTLKPGMRVGLVGPFGDSAEDMLGPWSARGRTADVVTVRDALAKRASLEKLVFRYAKGTSASQDDGKGLAEALDVAKRSDVVLVALGERAQWTGEAASRAHLDLSRNQEELLERIHALGKPMVLLLFNGRPLTISWAAEHVPAIVEAWFPGIEAGPALVRLLFGEIDPSGHLTASFPRSVGQEPLYYNALPTGRPILPSHPGYRFASQYIDELNGPLYPFGHGLSYTTFEYGNATADVSEISVASLRKGATVTVGADVANVGPRDGTTVVQCYVRLAGTSVALPVRQLKGFARVPLTAGAVRHVQFQLGWEDLAYWNADMKRTVEPSRLDLWVAKDSQSGVPATVTVTK
jgi:beta-glucosidase